MLKRKAYERFRDWKLRQPNKALVVTGARQVGKTYLIEQFAKESFTSLVEFDMVRDRDARESFSEASDADDLFLRMTVAAATPMTAGDTVVFIDEVQECPTVITLVKYLLEREGYRFILSGSLLGTTLENVDSLPVGYVTPVKMYPLDFEEFCWANGLGEDVLPQAEGLARSREPLPDYLCKRLLGLFRRYIVVGGMPDAVNAFLESSSLDEVRAVQQGIHALYREDITKYAPRGLRLTIRDIYDLIPSELGSKNRRFRVGAIEGVKRFAQVEDQVLWLTNAGVALAARNVTAPVSPLLLSERRNLFKLFYLDVGMLMAAYPKSVAQEVFSEGEGGEFSMNMGAAYEAFVAQELTAHGFALRYYNSKQVGELDFVEERQGGSILALEVKSGRGYRSHAALDNALAVKEYTIDRACVLAETNVLEVGRVLYLPIFLAGGFSYET